MRPQGKLGLALIAAGGAVYLFTPHSVTWGNHHYLKHALALGLIGLGGVLLIASSRG